MKNAFFVKQNQFDRTGTLFRTGRLLRDDGEKLTYFALLALLALKAARGSRYTEKRKA
jgi:hypothetical protein